MRVFARTLVVMVWCGSGVSCVMRQHEPPPPLVIEPVLTREQEIAADAVALQARRHRHSAEALYRTLLAENPVHAQAANNLAYLLADAGGDLEEAERLARRAITLEPANPRYLDTMGVVLIKAGREGEAVGVLEKAHARADALPVEEQRKIVMRLVAVYQSTGQDHLARQVMEVYRARDPEVNIR